MCVLVSRVEVRIICGSQFSASTVWIWGIELRWSGLAAATLRCCAICWTQTVLNVMLYLVVNYRTAAVFLWHLKS